MPVGRPEKYNAEKERKVADSISTKQYQDKQKEQDPVKWKRIQRNAQLKHKFGITLKQYNAMVMVQNYVCAICGQKETQMMNEEIVGLTVDHDHITGKIRKLLCRRCNSILGYVRDNPDILEKATLYLRFHQKKV